MPGIAPQGLYGHNLIIIRVNRSPALSGNKRFDPLNHYYRHKLKAHFHFNSLLILDWINCYARTIKMDYTKVITEELSYLQQQEWQARHAIVRDRIRYLRLLKSGQCMSQRAAGQMIGLGARQSLRRWQVYRQQDYTALVKSGYVHNFGKLDGC